MGSCPIGVIVLRGSCPQGSCPQGSCPRGSCPRASCPRIRGGYAGKPGGACWSVKVISGVLGA